MALVIEGGGINFGGNIVIGDRGLGNIADGGTVTTITDGGKNYTLHTFTANGTFTLNYPYDIQYLVIGPGGTGGDGVILTSPTRVFGGGGGGGGQVVIGNVGIDRGNYSIVVSSGIASAITELSVTAQPGGAGGTQGVNSSNGYAGASGGGAAGRGTGAATLGGSALYGGFAGGNGVSNSNNGGGGGGWTSAGQVPIGTWYGGTGITSTFSGSTQFYAGGGGAGFGGFSQGGGGNGARSGTPAENGQNYGGGGGGGYGTPALLIPGGTGGQGVVMIRYRTPP